MPLVEIFTGGKKQSLPLDRTITIGRQQGNDVVLDDTLASRRHCELSMRDGLIVLKDLDSHNGTYVGANKVAEAILSLGDVIRIGKSTIRLMPDEVDTSESRVPTAEVILDEDEEMPRGKHAKPDAHPAITAVAARIVGTGPLTRQLAPLMQAIMSCPVPPGAPESPENIHLMDKQSKTLQVDSRKGSKPAEALHAFRQLLFAAFRSRSTDIHIEPKPELYGLRFRIDGLMHNVGEFGPKMGQTLLNVIKVLCSIDIAKKSVVQEGSFAVELATRRVDFRVSLTPSTHGQKLALRILDKSTVPGRFEDLGMEALAIEEVKKVCSQDAGMIIVAGPTGSGKTTTLYTALKTIDANTRNIVTIEDPVEYQLDNTTQITIDDKHDLTFANVLGTVMRQDPDVILVGEIRDKETAQMAMQAAMTGHLVLTTVHARDTVGTIFRLLDLKIEPFLVANALSMTVSQRLVRRLCPHCKRAYKPDAKRLMGMSLEGRNVDKIFDSVGCPRCMKTGYIGRLALFEMLTFTSQLRDVIMTKPTIKDIRAAAGEWMFRSLRASGIGKVLEGQTTLDEVDRVSAGDMQ